LELNGTHLPLIYADDVHSQGQNTSSIKKDKETPLHAGKEVGIEMKEGKFKYMLMSRHQKAE
jgi:hypothetical protein